jgi:endonuclease/exonuclease/phosphatase family metal-dependent hydrolase
MEARILTWNLWWRFGPWRERQEAILSVLREQDADVIFLQEVWGQAGGLDQADFIAGELNMYVARTEGPWYDDEVSLGNAILSRWPIIEWRVHRLPDVTGAPSYRRAVVARLDYKFDQSSTRMAQCEALSAIVDSLREDPEIDTPVVMAGDFNAVPDSDEIRMLTGRREPAVQGLVFTDLWEVAGEGDGMTWRRDNPYIADSTWPNRRLDYLFVSWPRPRPLGNPTRVWLAGVDAVGGVQPSDHAAVVADIRMVAE